jgi:hypothetical protein
MPNATSIFLQLFCFHTFFGSLIFMGACKSPCVEIIWIYPKSKQDVIEESHPLMKGS